MKEKAENILPWRPIGLFQNFSAPPHRNAFAELKPTSSPHHGCRTRTPACPQVVRVKPQKLQSLLLGWIPLKGPTFCQKCLHQCLLPVTNSNHHFFCC